MDSIDEVVYRRLDESVKERLDATVWEGHSSEGALLARMEVFPGKEQWGVRIQDKVPEWSERDLVKLIANLLVWEIGCTADTVEVVFGRNHERQVLVRVGGDYV